MPVPTRIHKPSASAKQSILSGLKSPASNLGKGVRAVQRCERDLALPVRRNRADTKGTVNALVAEIDHWVRAHEFRGRRAVFRESAPDRLLLQRLGEQRAEKQALRSQLSESAPATLDGNEHAGSK